MNGPQRARALVEGTLPLPPFAVLIGLEVVEAGGGRTVFALMPDEYLYNPVGVVQGGMLCSLFDAALAIAIQSTLPAGAGMTTLDLHTTFLRPVSGATGRVRCIAEVLHLGRTVASAQARLVDAADRLLAHATTTCAVVPAQSAGHGLPTQ
jgi:uncharacterized protein (TIGR00369 family)